MDGQFDSRRVGKEITVCLAEQLKHLRDYNAVTQREIADALCIDRSTYAYYEKGKTQPPLFMLMKLAQLYDVTTDYLLGIQKAERQTSRFETELLLLVKKHFGDEAAPFR